MARIMAMTTTSLADAKNRLSELVASAETTHERTVVTKNGRPAAVLMSVDDLESLEETLALLSDREALVDLAESEITGRHGLSYTADQIWDGAHARSAEESERRLVARMGAPRTTQPGPPSGPTSSRRPTPPCANGPPTTRELVGRDLPAARRSLNRLPEKVRDAALAFIGGPLADNPYRVGKPLERELRRAALGPARLLPDRLPGGRRARAQKGRPRRAAQRRVPVSGQVAVLGLGPAGRAAASRLTAASVEVVAVDPAPDRRWTPTYAAWADSCRTGSRARPSPPGRPTPARGGRRAPAGPDVRRPRHPAAAGLPRPARGPRGRAARSPTPTRTG